MFEKYMDRYKVTREGNKTIATARFAQNPVYGYAKCDPADAFNEKVGSDIAILRCAEKINAKRVRNAEKKLRQAKHALEAAQRDVAKAEAYLSDAKAETAEIDTAMKNLMNGLF